MNLAHPNISISSPVRINSEFKLWTGWNADQLVKDYLTPVGMRWARW